MNRSLVATLLGMTDTKDGLRRKRARGGAGGVGAARVKNALGASALQLCWSALSIWFFGLFREGFVGTLAEDAFHAAREGHGAVAESVADAVHGGEGVLPFLLLAFDAGEQAELSGGVL